MTIKIDIPNEQLSEKILWLLDRFTTDGVKITTTDDRKTDTSTTTIAALQKIIKVKSKHSIRLDKDTILNPHNELIRDIS